MKVALEFSADNAAFDNPHEAARILRLAAERIDGYGNIPSEYPLFDLNGNRVGKITITESE